MEIRHFFLQQERFNRPFFNPTPFPITPLSNLSECANATLTKKQKKDYVNKQIAYAIIP